MRIDEMFDRSVFSNSAAKLLLNRDAIAGIIANFKDKTFDEWEERECHHCTPETRCKKHSALDRIIQTDRAVKVTGLVNAPLDGLYMSKSDMFLFNPASKSLLILDCPPLFSTNPINDVWIRKINPFSIGNFDDTLNFDITQTVDIEEILKHRTFSCFFGKIDGASAFLTLSKNYGFYHWKIEIK